MRICLVGASPGHHNAPPDNGARGSADASQGECSTRGGGGLSFRSQSGEFTLDSRVDGTMIGVGRKAQPGAQGRAWQRGYRVTLIAPLQHLAIEAAHVGEFTGESPSSGGIGKGCTLPVNDGE